MMCLLFYVEYVRIFTQAMYTYFLRNFLSRIVLPFNSPFLFKYYKDSFWTMAKTRLSLFQTLSCLKNMLVWGNIQNCSKKGKKGWQTLDVRIIRQYTPTQGLGHHKMNIGVIKSRSSMLLIFFSRLFSSNLWPENCLGMPVKSPSQNQQQQQWLR